MAKRKRVSKVKVQPIGAGKRVAELVWATVIGIAATEGANAAQRPSFADDDLATRMAQEKPSAVDGMMTGGGAEAASQVGLIDGIPDDIAQLLQSALDQDPSLDAASAAGGDDMTAGAAQSLPGWAAVDAMQGGLSLEPVYLAAADGGDTLTDTGSTIDWANGVQFAQASPGASGGSVATDAEAAAPAAIGMDMGLLALVGVGAALAGAGSGGGGGSASNPTPAPTPTPTINSVAGTVVDGYVAGAKVFIDSNGNGILDSGDAAAGSTDAHGNFHLTGSFTAGEKVFIHGGANNGIGDGNAMLVAMNVDMQGVVDANGQMVISPLTTLLATSGLTETALKTALGISQNVDLNSYDPVAALNGANSSAAEHVFASAQQVMTLLQTSVAAGVSFETAAQTLGTALNGGDLASATQAIVTKIGQVDAHFAGAAAQTQLLNSIENINAHIATAYSGLSEALGDPAAMAAALAVTTVAQTSFLDNVSSGQGVAQYADNSAGSNFNSLVTQAQSDITHNVQSVDATLLSDLLASGVSFAGDHIGITFNDTGDAALLSSLLTSLHAQGSTLDSLNVDSNLGDFQNTVLNSFTNAGFNTSGIHVAVGDY